MAVSSVRSFGIVSSFAASASSHFSVLQAYDALRPRIAVNVESVTVLQFVERLAGADAVEQVDVLLHVRARCSSPSIGLPLIDVRAVLQAGTALRPDDRLGHVARRPGCAGSSEYIFTPFLYSYSTAKWSQMLPTSFGSPALPGRAAAHADRLAPGGRS